jgi:hypothetical protein
LANSSRDGQLGEVAPVDAHHPREPGLGGDALDILGQSVHDPESLHAASPRSVPPWPSRAVGFVIDGVVRRFGDIARITSTSSERIGPAIPDTSDGRYASQYSDIVDQPNRIRQSVRRSDVTVESGGSPYTEG